MVKAVDDWMIAADSITAMVRSIEDDELFILVVVVA